MADSANSPLEKVCIDSKNLTEVSRLLPRPCRASAHLRTLFSGTKLFKHQCRQLKACGDEVLQLKRTKTKVNSSLNIGLQKG